MTCAEAYEAILGADPTDLGGTANGPLARHLSECDRCRKRADAVLEGEVTLGRDLLALVPAPDPDQILDRARIRPLSRRAHWVPVVPFAAAAALTALFFAREPDLPGPLYTPPETDVGMDVQAPEGQNMVVLKTNNPEITVLWLF